MASSGVTGFVDRIGLALVAPRRAFALSDELAGRGGLSDAFTLLLLKVLCLELPLLIRGVWSALVNGLGSGMVDIGRALQEAVGTDLILLLAAGLVITIGAGRRRAPSRDFDLGAVAWLPYFTIDVLAHLVTRVFAVTLGPAVVQIVSLAAFGTTAVFVALAIRHARSRGRSDDAAAKQAPQ